MVHFLERIPTIIEEEMKAMPSTAFTDPSYKLRLSDAVFCAEDVIRNRHFYQAIEQCFSDQDREDIVVLDAGSGTGILGFMALELGAQKCCFLEHNPHALELSKRVADRLGFTERSEFVEGDATKYELTEPFDLLLSETITSDFTREDFLPITQHLLSFGGEGVQVIPERFVLEYQSKTKDMDNIGPVREVAFTAKEGIGDHLLLVAAGAEFVEISSSCFLYGDVVLKSGMCSSFGNRSTVSLEELRSAWKTEFV